MYTKLAGWDNLLAAYYQAARHKRGRAEVAAFEYRLEENLLGLHRALLDETYSPGPYNSFFIHEPKRRLVSAAPFRDRVVHHALCNCIEPLFERAFVDESFANRIGKGTHRALDHAQACARRFSHVLQLDVRQFFPSIDHEILRRRLAKRIDDPAVLRLIERVLASGLDIGTAARTPLFPGDDLLTALRPRGLPVGNLTSQFWGNCFLDGLDHFIKRTLHCRGYVRYVDDLLLFDDDRARLWAWQRDTGLYLERLRLRFHAGAHPRPVGEGIPFLGFVLYPTRRLLKRRRVVAFRRRLGLALEALAEGRAEAFQVAAGVRGWLAHARWGDSRGLRRQVLGRLPRAVRRSLRG